MGFTFCRDKQKRQKRGTKLVLGVFYFEDKETVIRIVL